MYLIHYVLIICITPVFVHVSNSLCTYTLFYIGTFMYLIQSVHITCLTPVCVLLSISINACYLCNTCVCVCMFPIHYTLPLCVYIYLIQLVHNISAALCRISTCIIKSVHILYLCVHMNIITMQSVYSVRACVQCLSVISWLMRINIDVKITKS